VDEDRAVGVRLSNDEEYRADHIISTADGYSTLYDMLEGRFISKQLKDMHETWPLWKPVVMINYGVARDFSDEPHIVMFKAPKSSEVGFFADDWYVIRIFNYCPDCAPEGRTLVQVMIESAWQPWKELREDKEAYKAEKDKTARVVLDCLNDIWPGMKDQVDMTNVATPYTWWRYTRNREGAFEGFAITDKIFKAQVKRTLPGLKNFYMAGQWVIPGGGVIPTLMSGRHAAMLLCKGDNISFQTTFADD
jgi:phytoene dehydrogenase-like protein